MVWGEAVPQITGHNIPFAIRARVCLLRDLGSCLSPDNAFQVIQGIETLLLRMRQNSSNAERVVDFLEDHPKVERVIYPKNYDGVVGERAERYFNGGFGALVGLELKGGIEAGKYLSIPSNFFIMLRISVMQGVLPFILQPRPIANSLRKNS